MVSTTNRHLDNDETNAAAWVAARGAATGAAKWGLFGGFASALAYAVSPMYRGFTIQFKVFLQMSAMTLGSMIEADQRLRAHEMLVRRQKRFARDEEVWRRYEAAYERNRPASASATSSGPADGGSGGAAAATPVAAASPRGSAS